MSHAAGSSGMDQMMSPDDMYDWDKIVALLAAQAPWWNWQRTGYHAITQGYLIGEVATNYWKIARYLFPREIGPLGADFFIGVGQRISSD